MKSIREWMMEKGMLEEDVNVNHFTQMMTGGSSTFRTNPVLKSKLKEKINNAINDLKDEAEKEGENISQLDILREIMGIVTMMVMGKTGSVGNARSIGRELNKEDPSEPIMQEPR